MKEDVKFSQQATMKEVNDSIKKFMEDDIPILVTVMKVCGVEFPCAVREDKDAL